MKGARIETEYTWVKWREQSASGATIGRHSSMASSQAVDPSKVSDAPLESHQYHEETIIVLDETLTLEVFSNGASVALIGMIAVSF